MKIHSVFLAAAIGALALGSHAMAAAFNSNPGPYVAPPGVTILDNFDSPVPGVTLSGNYQIVSGTTVDNAAPLGDTSKYLSVPVNGSSGTAIMDFSALLGPSQKIDELSFYWGSLDSYNSINFLNSLGQTIYTIAGTQFGQNDGCQTCANTNRNFDVFFGAGEAPTAVQFISTNIALETDNWNFSAVAVPEPSTWALAIVGIGMIGLVLRKKRSNPVNALAA